MKMMILVLGIFSLVIHSSTAVRCFTNPCKLDEGQFTPPFYNCLEVPERPNTVYCTCPNGIVRENAPCRVCDDVNCGPAGLCVEKPFFSGLFYACGCTGSTGNYLSPNPCPGTVMTTMTTTSTTTTKSTTPFCSNGGFYSLITGTCICPPLFTGRFCELSVANDLCKNIVCENGGVCNQVPTANNDVVPQCSCLNGYAGPNCELVGSSGRCSSSLCKNGGVCDEYHLGSSIFAYCLCPPGFHGQRCDTRYFSCSQTGLYKDTVNCKYGKYFQCLNTLATTRVCPRGTRFNEHTNQCEWNVGCS